MAFNRVPFPRGWGPVFPLSERSLIAKFKIEGGLPSTANAPGARARAEGSQPVAYLPDIPPRGKARNRPESRAR